MAKAATKEKASLKVSRADLNGLFIALGMPMASKWSPTRLLDKVNKLADVVDEETDAGEFADLLDSLLEATGEKRTIEITEGTTDGVTKSPKSRSANNGSKAKAAEAEEADDEDEEEPADDEDEEEPADDEDEEEEEEPAPKKAAAKKTKPAPAAEEDDDEDEEEEQPAKPAKKKAAAAEAPAKKKGAVEKKPAKKAQEPKGPGVIASIIEFLQAATAKKPLSKDALCAKLAERFPERDADSMMRTINVQVPNRLKADKDLTVEKNEKGYWLPS